MLIRHQRSSVVNNIGDPRNREACSFQFPCNLFERETRGTGKTEYLIPCGWRVIDQGLMHYLARARVPSSCGRIILREAALSLPRLFPGRERAFKLFLGWLDYSASRERLKARAAPALTATLSSSIYVRVPGCPPSSRLSLSSSLFLLSCSRSLTHPFYPLCFLIFTVLASYLIAASCILHPSVVPPPALSRLSSSTFCHGYTLCFLLHFSSLLCGFIFYLHRFLYPSFILLLTRLADFFPWVPFF